MRRKPVCLTLLLLMVFTSASCRGNAGGNRNKQKPEPPVVLSLGTDEGRIPEQGVSLAVGYNWLLKPCPDHNQALLSLMNRESGLVLIRADHLYTLLSAGGKPAADIRSNCRSLGSIAFSPVMILTRSADTPQDLRKERINVGPQDSPEAAAGIRILAGLGLSPRRDYNPEGLNYPDAFNALSSGKLDSLIWIEGDGILPAGMARRYPPLSLSSDEESPLYRANPWLTPYPVTTYINPRLPATPATPSAAIPWLLICQADREEQEIYRLTRKLFKKDPELRKHGGEESVIPLHPGSARYFSLSSGTLE